MTQYVVVLFHATGAEPGDDVVGTAHGPFETEADAERYADGRLEEGEGYAVRMIQPPEVKA
jgi:hypothetical protein